MGQNKDKWAVDRSTAQNIDLRREIRIDGPYIHRWAKIRIDSAIDGSMAHLRERGRMVRGDEGRRDRRALLGRRTRTGRGREAPFVLTRYPRPHGRPLQG